MLERARDVPDALSWSETVTGDVRYIALRPEVSQILDLAGVEYGRPGEYTEGERIYRHGLASFDEIHRLCAYLDERLAVVHGVQQLRPAAYAFYHLKILWDVLFTTVSVLQGILLKECPDLIRVYAPADIGSSPYAFSNDESVYAAVLRLEGWPVEVEVVETAVGEDTPISTAGPVRGLAVSLQGVLGDYSSLFNLGTIVRRRGVCALLPAALRSLTGIADTPLLLYESGYNWDDALLELYQNGFSRITRVRDSSVEIRLSDMERYRETILDTCLNAPACRELGRRGGIDTSPLLFEKVAWFVARATAEALATYPKMVRIIRDCRVGAVLLSVRESAVGHALVRAAHDCEIPVISWQHGGAGYCYHPLMPFIESVDSDIHLVFGDSVAKAYRETDRRLKISRPPEIVAVGSSSLDRLDPRPALRSRRSSGCKTILYVTTAYLHNQYTISAVRDPTVFDEELWSVQKAVIDLARAHPDHAFIVKLHPGHTSREPLKRYIEHHRIRNVRLVVRSPSLPVLLKETDLLLFDLISTGILQALQTDLPVFLYSGLSCVDEDTLLPLKQRVSIYETVKEYSGAINRYLSGEPDDPSVNVLDETFMIGFGTCRGDGRSAERAAAIIREAIAARQGR